MKIKILFKLIADSRTGYLKIMLALHIIKDERSTSAVPAVNKQECHSGRYSRNREATPRPIPKTFYPPKKTAGSLPA